MRNGSGNARIFNYIRLGFFCTLLGATAGAVVWAVLKIVELGTSLFWEWIPSKINPGFYPLILCTALAFLLGILRKKYGDYPEELETVFSKFKKDGNYNYKALPMICISAVIALVMGSSVGPEAGLTGIIVALCCWIGSNATAAAKDTREYSRVGVAVTLGVLFHSPLFGLFSVEEDSFEWKQEKMKLAQRLLLYGLALGAATLLYTLLYRNFGGGLSGFPSFEMEDLQPADYLMGIIYAACGILLGMFFEITQKICRKTLLRIPPVLRETIGGLVIGITAMTFPRLLFSGEEEMGKLIDSWGIVIPAALIAAALAKIVLTNFCIQSGLKGGHFFPVIFAGVCMGYGIAMLTLGGDHAVFGAAIVTAALLGRIMRKPLAVAMLLLICFPVKLLLWIFLAAALGAKIFAGSKGKRSHNGQDAEESLLRKRD